MSESTGTRAPGTRAPAEPTGSAETTRTRAAMAEEVFRGLSGTQKVIAPKYFYDRRGSELFEEITALPEYYLTRAEMRLLEGPVRRWIESTAPASLVELGAGSARKTRVILEAMTRARRGAIYVPVDVSAGFLAQTAEAVRQEYPAVTVRPVVADITRPLRLEPPPRPPVLFALLGSTIGNFTSVGAIRLLGGLAERMGPGDSLLLGLDLAPGPDKPVEVLEAAYDDAAGVTERFNRNVLHVLNRELDTDFDPDAFEHRAVYVEAASRVEMHLVSTATQRVRFPGRGEIRFEPGETIRTEISCKYDRDRVVDLFAGSGLELSHWFEDDGRYALAAARCVP